MTDIQFTSKMTVERYDQVGDDLKIARMAWVSSIGNADHDESDERVRRLVRSLLKNGHPSPFRHNSITFYFHVPIFIARQIMRSHVGVEFSEESGRYHQLDPLFWHPGRKRPIATPDDFKPMRPKLIEGNDWQHTETQMNTRAVCTQAWHNYVIEINDGIAPEVARRLLPLSTYTSLYGTFNLNSLITFLTKRQSGRGSYPQYEIEDVANQMEQSFAECWPITYEEWVKLERPKL